MRNHYLPVLIFLLFLFVGCSDTSSGPGPLDVPAEYPSANFESNTSQQRALLDQISTLATAMQAGRSGQAVEFSVTSDLFAPIRPTATMEFSALADGFLLQLSKASGGAEFDPMMPPEENADGGLYGGILFDEHGIELQQLVDKGLYAAAGYHQMIQLMKNSRISIAELDGCVALFGASPAFPNGASNAVSADRFVAKYAARRDKNDGTGPYTAFRDAARTVHGAVTAGDSYVKEQRDGLSEMRARWERSQMATVVNYLYATIGLLSKTTVTVEDRAEAMHGFSECVGFILGWRGVEEGVSIINATQVDELLSMMRTPATGTWTPYLFWQKPAQTLPELQSVLNTIQTIYGFTDADMESFRYNWVEVQGR